MFTTIVDASTLRDHLDDPNWIIVDCRHKLADFDAGRHMYLKSHIPGAFFADSERNLSGAKSGSNGRHPLPEVDDFLEYLRNLGATDDTQFVAYDGGADMFAARFWMLCRLIGHEAVAVLDGGFGGWGLAGYATTQRAQAPAKYGTITAGAPLDPMLNVDDVADGHDAVFLDARAGERFRGETEPVDPIPGHIPGARNRWFRDNYDEQGWWKSPALLKQELKAYGPPAQVVNYCGSGVSAAVNMLAFEIAGLHGGSLYPGGWSEWCTNPMRTIELGEEK